MCCILIPSSTTFFHTYTEPCILEICLFNDSHKISKIYYLHFPNEESKGPESTRQKKK